jgi:flagellar hook capping protein FlgD
MSSPIRILPVLLLLAAASAAVGAPAQQGCEGCRWGDRGDRSEGVREEPAMISGGSFELLSVSYLHSPAARGGGAQMRLYFWLPEARKLDEVVVWKPLPSKTHDKVSYRMEPERKQYGKGLQEFAWPRGEVIARLGIAPEALHTRVKAGEVFLPALLTAGEPPAPAGGYAFVFASGAGIDAECIVTREGAAQPIRRFECYEEKGGEITFEWDGRDGQGRPAPDGVYVLKVAGDMQAEVLRPVETSLRFQHRGRLQ